MVAIEPLSKYLNGFCGGLALEPAVDLLGGVLRALDRDLGDAGQVVEGDHVADDEHLGVAGQREVGVDADPAGPVQRRAGLLGQGPGELAGLDAGGPDLGDGRDPLDPAVLVPDLDAALVDVGDHRAEHDLDAELLQLAAWSSRRAWRRTAAAPGRRRRAG